ncbi:MAG: type II toxin-antitoxin system prevent-host-death family antitoxin [Nitrospinae bacterium]|nr:type II toxin-antitoxin system prevent-host-death family antitoxin [Nitrospinota bacterium]
MKVLRKKKIAPEVVLRNGEPAAVIIDIDEYREILERLEDSEDIKTLEKIRKRPQKFRKLDDFLKEGPPCA